MDETPCGQIVSHRAVGQHRKAGDGKALAEAIKSTGKKLTTIYISQSDPDYYFSLAPIKAAFPDAGMGVALQVGAKVARGEMKWG